MNISPVIMWNGKGCTSLRVKYMGAHCVHVSISRRSTHGICYRDSVDSPREAWRGVREYMHWMDIVWVVVPKWSRNKFNSGRTQWQSGVHKDNPGYTLTDGGYCGRRIIMVEVVISGGPTSVGGRRQGWE